mmetsp:Transcript_38952/g.97093  ORF Transcript_38952/g.97093 Transcript_38952/m.97093 type:complete len:148 (-) Transcript_38952:278-721(-)
MGWSKKSAFRKYCRRRTRLRTWLPPRRSAHAAEREYCPRHDKNQHRRCEQLPTCPPIHPRNKNGSVAARRKATLHGEREKAEETAEAQEAGPVEEAQEDEEIFEPPDEVFDDVRFHRDDEFDPDPDPHPSARYVPIAGAVHALVGAL